MNMNETTLQIRLKATYIDSYEGMVTVEIPAVELSYEAQELIRELLPDLQESFAGLLRKQAILKAIA